jgi:transaldolase
MALYLDSADPEHARQAAALGFVEGIITNPQVIRQTGGSSLEVLEQLVEIFDGAVFYQPTAPTPDGRIDEAWQAYDLRPDRVVIKLPASTENLRSISRLSEIDIALTAVYSPLQAYVAAEIGVPYIIHYLNHLRADNTDLLKPLAQMTRLLSTYDTEILVKPISSLEMALHVLEAGAHHLILPFELLTAIGDHPLSQRIIEERFTDGPW